MFSFHKPRVYRSTEGCCICRAKSSSSRFTDSKKYENDSVKCFNLNKPRQGEICNACVLLVKRFKRLPVGSNRHWGHVVDARIGPGLKSMSKFKKLKEENMQQQQNSSENGMKSQNGKTLSSTSSSSLIPEKFCKIFKKNKKKQTLKEKDKREATPASWDEQSLPATPESFNSDCEDTKYSSQRLRRKNGELKNKVIQKRSNRRNFLKPKKNFNQIENTRFFDEHNWKQIKSCCGLIFENREIGALIFDIQSYKPCLNHASLRDSSNTNFVHSKSGMTDIHNSPKVDHNNRKLHLSAGSARNVKDEQISVYALKKHHIFFKRQMENFSRVNNQQTNVQKTETDSANILANKLQEKNENLNIIKPEECYKLKNALLQQVKPDTGLMVQHSLDKFNMLYVKQSDSGDGKGLVKIIEKPLQPKACAKLKIPETPCNKNIDISNTKFSDNSSDSGFDENMLERKSTSPPSREEDKKVLIQPIQTMFLASGVQICGTQQHLIMTGNEVAARMLQTRRQSQMNSGMKGAQNTNGRQKVSAIYNKPSEGELLSIPGNSAITSPLTTFSTPSTTSMNQKIIVVKAKYNNQPAIIN